MGEGLFRDQAGRSPEWKNVGGRVNEERKGLPGMRQLTVETFQEMLLFACDAMIAAKTQLCELDGFVGDGDHGVTVERGFLAVKKQLQSSSFYSLCKREPPAQPVGKELKL